MLHQLRSYVLNRVRNPPEPKMVLRILEQNHNMANMALCQEPAATNTSQTNILVQIQHPVTVHCQHLAILVEESK